MKRLILLITFLNFLSNSNAQEIIAEDSTLQDRESRISYIFQHLDALPNIPENLWDKGLPLVDFNPEVNRDGQDHADVVANSALFGLSYASIFSIPKPVLYLAEKYSIERHNSFS